jgi:hypothetical protein
MHNNAISSKSLDVVFKRICFTIKKKNQQWAYCPFIFHSIVIIFLYIINLILKIQLQKSTTLQDLQMELKFVGM